MFTSTAVPWLSASALAIIADDTAPTTQSTAAPATVTSPIRQSITSRPIMTVTELVRLATTGVMRWAPALPTNIVPLTAIWDTAPVFSRVNQPSGNVTR